MVIQEHGNLNNYVLLKGESRGITEVKEFKTREIIYTKIRHKAPGGAYVSKLVDPITQAVLAEVQGKKSSAKLKQLLLYQPDDCIELKDSGILTFEYKFFWENEKYVWKKRNIVGKELECKMVHGDDPGIGVCMFKQENKTLGCITIMHYNMERIPVTDKKGLEYLLIMSLFSILDKWDDDNITKQKNEFILDDESNGDTLKEEVKLLTEREKEKDRKKNSNKKSEKLIIQLAEEEAILQEKLRQLKAQEKEDEEFARELQKKFSDPNYNEETADHGNSTSNNSEENPIRPTTTSDNSAGYIYTTESTSKYDKRLRPPTPPSSFSSAASKYGYTYSSTAATTPSSSSEQEEYYRKRPPPTPPSPLPPSSAPANLYSPPSWDSSPYTNPTPYYNNISMPSTSGQYYPNNYGTAPNGGYYDPQSQFNNNYPNPVVPNTNNNYSPYYGNTGYGEYNNGYNNEHNSRYHGGGGYN